MLLKYDHTTKPTISRPIATFLLRRVRAFCSLSAQRFGDRLLSALGDLLRGRTAGEERGRTTGRRRDEEGVEVERWWWRMSE